MVAEPDLVGGLDRLDSTILKAGGGRVVAKEGADGLLGLAIVHDAFPEGLGVVIKIAHGWDPELEIDGEMQADTAVLASVLEESYPWSRLSGPANVLVFPELQSANVAYKLVWRLAGAEAIGPILLGLAKPVHVLQRGVEVADIVNMTAICVVDAQETAAPPVGG